MTVTVIPRDLNDMSALSFNFLSAVRGRRGEDRYELSESFSFRQEKLGWGDIHLLRIINPAFTVLEKTMIQMKQVEKSRWC